MGKKFDFSGWATRNDLLCSDGRTIRRDAFKNNDGKTVPLVWNHQHNDNFNILGHALLENRPEGVYAYCSFNDTESGRNAKMLVEHGDVSGLSIYANKLKQQGGNVLHGAIREVSLVLASANPGAFIDSIMVHGDELDDEAIIYTGEDLFLSHSEPEEPQKEKKEEMVNNNEKTIQDVFNELTEEQKNVVYFLISQALEDAGVDGEDSEPVQHADNGDKTVQDVFNEFTEEQKKVVYFLIGQALEDAGVEDEEDEGDDEEMNHNIFENDANTDVLTHADMQDIFRDAKARGSLRDAVEAKIQDGTLVHAVTDEGGNPVNYGIANIDYLFPEAKTVGDVPEFIMRRQDWVTVVMNGVHHTPFSRIKSIFANITMDEARAKGYIKGKMKKEEVFSLLKRSTTPTTVYKKQKLDRDDIIDIVDFDIVMWLKKEMRIMLDEELARAYLIGDGRLASDDDKIDPEHIRPIWTDSVLFTINKTLTFTATATNDEKANLVIDGVIEAQENFEGTGTPTMFVDKWFLTRALLMRNSIGERVYKTKQELADEMGVANIVPVPVFKNQTRTVDGGQRTLVGIIVNLNDYNVGADKGGEVNLFDDFDIDYNQMKYLIESRCSGALIRPYSAIAVEYKVGE